MSSFAKARRGNVQSENPYIRKLKQCLKSLLFDKGLMIVTVAFLLGRSIILSIISPFPIAFLATVWFIQREKTPHVWIATLLGAITLSNTQFIYVLCGTIVFMLFVTLLGKTFQKRRIVPIFTFLSTTLAHLFLKSFQGPLLTYDWLILLIEGLLGAVLVLIFIQCIPLLSFEKPRFSLKNEEIICMIILLATILTGTAGWDIYGAQVEQVFSRYIVLIFSYVGGAAIGSSVGVVTGLILSLSSTTNLYQMSLLAFSGLLSGLLKEGRKIGVSIGLFVGTSLVGIYGDIVEIIPFFTESIVAILLFICTPLNFIQQISKLTPGTEEYTEEQQQYLQKIRNVTAERVDQFAHVFEALSKSFETDPFDHKELDDRQDTDYFLSRVTEKTCQSCFMKEKCWKQQFDQTYTLMSDLKKELEKNPQPNMGLFTSFERHCIKSNHVVQTIREEISFDQAQKLLKRQLLESKRLVADQLQGVSRVMGDFAKEILKEKENHEKQEYTIVQAMKQLGISLEKLEIYQLSKGNIDIEMTITFDEYRGEGPKLIAPALSDILKEFVVVKKEDISPFPNGYSSLSFGSAKNYIIQTGVANVAKGGGFISGDSYTMLDLGTGKYAIAISDGMGNGERAKEESEETLRLLRQILQTGIPEKVAIQSINSILSLRTTEEVYATLDLAVINLHNAFVRFLKVGSIPSIIKRGKKILRIEASNLPIGIIPNFDIEIVSEQLKPGDILIMMSDGVFDGTGSITNREAWLKRKILDLKTDHPQEIADLLLEEVVRARFGKIEDDMTVLVAKIERNKPEWSTISIQHAP